MAVRGMQLVAFAMAIFAVAETQPNAEFNPRFRPLPDRDQTLPGCRGKAADVFFVLDSSSSIYIEDFELQRQFVREVISRLDISATQTRIGIVTYSDNYRVSFDLGDYSDKVNLKNAVNVRNVPYLKGVTNTAEAIRYVRTNRNFRPEVTRVMIVVTDGYSRNQGATIHEADTARTEGFYLFVVGLGQYTDEREWRSIANDPDHTYIYNLTSGYRALDRLYSDIPEKLCELRPIIPNSDICNIRQDADLIFVAGPSKAIRAFGQVSNIIDAIRDNRARLRLSLFLGACTETGIPLRDPSLFCSNLGDSVSRQDSYSNLLKNMRRAARDSRGNRPRANQVAVLFIDEDAMRYDRLEIIKEARRAQSDGIKIYVVDVGVINNRNSLNIIASGADYVLSTRDTSINELESILLDKTCDALNIIEFSRVTVSK